VVLFYPVLIAKLILPIPPWQRFCQRILVGISYAWTMCNAVILRWCSGFRIETELAPGVQLRNDARYLIFSNHQAGTDIFALHTLFHPRTPFLTFFLKRQLLYAPIFGPIWWALGFPFMRRHSPAYLAKHPEKKGQDLVTTKKFCERIRGKPYSIVNFVEGTRRKPGRDYDSPFKHLLVPKAGGIAIALQALDYEFDYVLDVTLRYRGQRIGFWDMLAGRVGTVRAHVRLIPVSEIPRGDYFSDPTFAEQFREWLNGVWTEKDRLFEAAEPARQSA
jgi:1-acyl-sn-glycerol-3-phosphate acyltransferase